MSFDTSFHVSDSKGFTETRKREGGREGIYLGDIYGTNADPLGSINPEGHGEGVKAHCLVALDGLEVVDDCDTEPGQTRGEG